MDPVTLQNGHQPGRLPNFLIIGAQKSGTTSLQRYLSDHPEAHCIGETHFFDFRFDRGVDWYRSHFDGFADRKTLGEKCPSYLFHVGAIRRMAELIPDARLIVLLRDPVDRAYSHYWHVRKLGGESLPFEEAIAAEPERIAAGQWNLAYAARGRYLRQLERVCELYPRANLSVHLFEDMRRDPAAVFADVCRFLEIADVVRPGSLGTVANAYSRIRSKSLWALLVGGRIRSGGIQARIRRALTAEATYPPMDESVRRRLSATFADDNAALAAWLGRDLVGWTPTTATSL